jgi:hypothetical protein
MGLSRRATSLVGKTENEDVARAADWRPVKNLCRTEIYWA